MTTSRSASSCDPEDWRRHQIRSCTLISPLHRRRCPAPPIANLKAKDRLDSPSNQGDDRATWSEQSTHSAPAEPGPVQASNGECQQVTNALGKSRQDSWMDAVELLLADVTWESYPVQSESEEEPRRRVARTGPLPGPTRFERRQHQNRIQVGAI